MSFQIKIKETLNIGWENPSLNKQVNHVNLTLSLLFSILHVYILYILIRSLLYYMVN